MVKFIYPTKYLLVLVTLLLLPAQAMTEPMNSKAHAVLLHNKAKNKHLYQATKTGPDSHQAMLRSYRGSNIAGYYKQVGCGGVSLGNVNTTQGNYRSHSTTVIIQGHIINSGNGC